MKQGAYITLEPWREKLRVFFVLALCMLVLHSVSTVTCNDGVGSHPVNAIAHGLEKAEASSFLPVAGGCLLGGSLPCIDTVDIASYLPTTKLHIPTPIIVTLGWFIPILKHREIVSRFVPFLRASPSTHLEAQRTIVILT